MNMPKVILKEAHLTLKESKKLVNKLIMIIEMTLESFGIQAQVVEVYIEDKQILFGLAISMGTRVSQIVSLKDDLTLALSAPGKIEIYPVIGRDLIEIKVPTKKVILKKERYKVITKYKELPKVSDWMRIRAFVADLLMVISRLFSLLGEKIRK